MSARLHRGRAWWLVLWGLALGVTSCTNDPFDPTRLPNQPPVARIFVGGDSLNSTSYNQATFHWSGTDVDGFVVGFHVSIAEGSAAPTDWIFTAADESTATYNTDEGGQAFPTLYVVAEDDRGALSDTVSTVFPLVNFPPVLEFRSDFTPLTQSFGAASFDFFGFDLDGDETLLPQVQYRYEGSDPEVVYGIGDPLADPTVGWVTLSKSPTRFSLLLRDIPAGDPENDWEQTLYARIVDEAEGVADFSYTWQVFEVRGEVLLVDDNRAAQGRDQFYRDALDAHLGDAWSSWDVAAGLPERDDDVWLTLSLFKLVVWYTGDGESANLLRAQQTLLRFLSTDLDLQTEGVQPGRLLLATPMVVGGSSNLSTTFRTNAIGVESTWNPRNPLATYASATEAALGPLDIYGQVAGLPDLVSVGMAYQNVDSGRYFGLYGLVPRADAAALWRFEEYIWGGAADPLCRFGCEPVVAVRRPANGRAAVVTLAFQIDWANAAGTALDAIGVLLGDHLGFFAPPGARP